MGEFATVENLKTLAALLAGLRTAKTEREKLALWDKHLNEIIRRIAPEMASKPKLTTAIATSMVERIEKLQGDIDAIYADATLNYDGTNNGNVIHDAVKARKEQRDAEGYAGGLLASFDVTDEAA